MLQCVAVCCSVLQCVAVCCSVLLEQVLQGWAYSDSQGRCASVLQCCDALQGKAYFSMLQSCCAISVFKSSVDDVLQNVVVRCSLLMYCRAGHILIPQ